MNLVNKNKPGDGEAEVDTCVYTNAGESTPMVDEYACLDGKEIFCRLTQTQRK